MRAFRRERREERDYAVSHHTVIRKKLLAEKLQLVVSSGWGLLIPGASLVIVGFGAYLVIQSKGTIGDIVAFQMYAMMLLQPVSSIVNSYSATQQALTALRQPSLQETRLHHAAEKWRDRLMAHDNDALVELLESHPGANRQHFGRLLRSARNSPDDDPQPSRALYRALRELLAAD